MPSEAGYHPIENRLLIFPLIVIVNLIRIQVVVHIVFIECSYYLLTYNFDSKWTSSQA